MIYKMLPGGSIVFNNNVNISRLDKVFKNYIQDKDNPYLFHPDYKPCKHRICNNQQTKCGMVYPEHRCLAKNGIALSVVTCRECDEPTKGE